MCGLKMFREENNGNCECRCSLFVVRCVSTDQKWEIGITNGRILLEKKDNHHPAKQLTLIHSIYVDKFYMSAFVFWISFAKTNQIQNAKTNHRHRKKRYASKKCFTICNIINFWLFAPVWALAPHIMDVAPLYLHITMSTLCVHRASFCMRFMYASDFEFDSNIMDELFRHQFEFWHFFMFLLVLVDVNVFLVPTTVVWW